MNIPSIEAPRSNDPSGGPLSTSMERSPAFPGSGSQQRTPMSYELQSPASNASSYLRSVDPQGTISGIPEVSKPASNASSYLRSVDPQGTISGIPEVSKPASNASSYLRSVDPQGTISGIPEVSKPASNASSYLRSVDPQGTISGIPEVEQYIYLGFQKQLPSYSVCFNKVEQGYK